MELLTRCMMEGPLHDETAEKEGFKKRAPAILRY